MKDFTLMKYKELCLSAKKKYLILPVIEYIEKYQKADNGNNLLILRHDVDRFPKMALNMARMEYELGIRATYYFRYPYTFNKSIIKSIYNMGHEVGYHYECLGKAKGDHKKAIKIFKQELESFNDLGINVQTICAHGQPLSKWLNIDLWKHYRFQDFGILGDAYLSFSNDNIAYFSDTGRTWRQSYMKSGLNKDKKYYGEDIKSTDDLIKLIKGTKYKRIYLLVHPERWAASTQEWIRSFMLDKLFNAGKLALQVIRQWR